MDSKTAPKHQVGSADFCPHCQSLLESPDVNMIMACSMCPYRLQLSGATYSVETSSLRLKQDEHSLVASAAKAKFKSDKQQAVTDSKKSAAAKTAKSGAAKPSAAAAASDRKQPQSASAKAAAAAATAAMEDSDSDSEAVTSEQKRNAGGAILNEPCPECGEFEVTFHTMQLRSADEGQTVFKKCNNCDWQEKENS